VSTLALVAAVLLSGAGLLLERTCRVKGADDDDEPPELPAV